MNPYLSLVERRNEQRPIQVMFIGPALSGVTNVFRRADEPIQVQHTNSINEFMKLLETQSFDCVMVDQRREEAGSDLNIVSLAASQKVPHLIVMAAANSSQNLVDIAGVHEVLEAPVTPQQIVKSIISASEKLAQEEEVELAEEARKAENNNVVSAPVAKNRPAETIQTATQPAEVEARQPAPAEGSVKQQQEQLKNASASFRTSLEVAKDIDGQVWQKFLPLINFLYKKSAITVLSALFLTFLFYGIMIVFFMASGSWSMPFELSRGHELVMRSERDIGQLTVRRNQVRQSLKKAEADLENATRARRDAELILSISEKTVDLELAQQLTLAREAKAHINRLKRVINDFNENNKKNKFAKDLTAAYRQRTITQKSLHAGTLAVLETLHRMATVSNELALKEIEHDRINNRLLFLRSLKAEMREPEIRTIVSAGSDFVHLAREIIQAKAIISQSEKAFQTSLADVEQSRNSLKIVSTNMSYLKNTPVGRAINEPVTVLFVPYTNSDNFEKGQPLYGCFASIFFCSKVGTVGDTIQGESTAVHPLFGKPLRGVFVEAHIEKPEDIKEELLHVGRPPLLF